MTQDEIIEMAKQVWGELACTMHIHQIEAFAKLVAEAEREACANVCDESMKWHKVRFDTLQAQIAATCASSIRARGKKA